MDPSGLETSDKTIKWSDNSSQNSVESRSYSYRCTFCKRGFSNAQALGGHMNIHRKDRAKLREFSSENLLVLDITKNMDCQDNPQANSDDKADDDHQENNPGNIDPRVEDSLIRRLPLFSEKPSVSSDDHGKEASDDHSEKIVEKGKMEVMSHGEVDLELRLGPEPVDSKAINE